MTLLRAFLKESASMLRRAPFRVDTIDVLGMGGEGKVYGGTMVIDGKERRIAIKVYPAKADTQTPSKREQAFFERFKNVHLPFVVKYYGSALHTDQLYLGFELCTGGDLHNFLMQHGLQGYDQVKLWWHQIALAVGALHSHGFAHRDIKLENVLLYRDRTIRLADFSFSCKNAPDLTQYCGTPAYAAPEVCSGQPYDGQCADAWSLGVLLYALVEGRMPFADKAHICDLDTTHHYYRTPDVPKSFRQTIDVLLNKKHPGRRYAALQSFRPDMLSPTRKSQSSAHTTALRKRKLRLRKVGARESFWTGVNCPIPQAPSGKASRSSQ